MVRRSSRNPTCVSSSMISIRCCGLFSRLYGFLRGRGLQMAPRVFSFNSSRETGKGESFHVMHGFSKIKGKARHPMEDVLVSLYKEFKGHKLGLFAVYDGHLGRDVADYLEENLFDTILDEPDLFCNPKTALENAYHSTDAVILQMSHPGGSTAVTAIVVDNKRLLVANVGDSRAVLCEAGEAKQLSVDHEPSAERQLVESRGGHVTHFPGDVARVDGQLAVARAFGDKSLKQHLSAEPHVCEVILSERSEFMILGSDGLWKVIENQVAVDLIRGIKDPEEAAKCLTSTAVQKKSRDDISCIVVRFHA
ncbi:probable protein phosphatase 2C 58 isoform X8 [Selaginella moellendorffii]|uniref:probable protein phosphatase 2C 58 isoform X8 n=1 Tax=Selaginella moellendorffii TaxID=88036 RepID=UPI000D1CC4C0|nr:probable protein phosphatase 2C 58 isoform X8 [Selaginella moellendorffii]XP_024529220.1 probable protein phosphatase 2C 58 isoform X8 [Selaginella moellendorffii]|eukprot:XP_024529219.1 probable protein phosphatase 2C 58 isoform X8 [Selaginella moellendorffii]